jgi:TIGR03009 family protein
MLRNLGVGRLIVLMLLGVWGASGSWLRAQDASSNDRGIAPATDQHGVAEQPRERVDRSGLTRPDLRADAVGKEGEPVDPRIDALLQEWSDRTKQIKRLQGTHIRATRNFDWGNESWAEGRFYVETPDKGRIDIRPYSKDLPKEKDVKPRRNPAGRLVKLNIVRDSKHDRWICDGKEIKAIDDDNKTYEAVKIPPNQQGVNIMDGPLPFLFGMPPERAKARYRFKLLAQNEKAYAIQVRPNLKQDAVDWMQAELLLDRKTCLPLEVHLHNAAGTSETVYMFKDLQVNRIRFFFWSDPFEPSMASYTRSVHNTPPAGPNADPVTTNRMPSLIGMPWQPVKQKMESLGLRSSSCEATRRRSPHRSSMSSSNSRLRTPRLIEVPHYSHSLRPDGPKPATAPTATGSASSNRSEYRNEGPSHTVAKPPDP